MSNEYSVCVLGAGAGGAALGWERAGFAVTAIDDDTACCDTLRANRPRWRVHRAAIPGLLPGLGTRTADVVSAAVPCPPLAPGERFDDLFPEVGLVAAGLGARALVVTTARAPMSERFAPFRYGVQDILAGLGYTVAFWSVVDSQNFGVAQCRPRSLMVALRSDVLRWWLPPSPRPRRAPTVSQVLADSMAERGMNRRHAREWAQIADKVAPAIVPAPPGYGPGLGPARSKRQWATIGLDGCGVAADDDTVTIPGPHGRGPHLTVNQISLLQGMPDRWVYCGDMDQRSRQASALSCPQIFHAYAAQVRAALRAADA